MFKAFRDVAEALKALRDTIDEGTTALEAALHERTANDVLSARIDSLEGELAKNLARAEAISIEGESRFKAARAAEERERANAKRAEAALSAASDEEGEGEIPEWYLDQLRPGDAGGGPEEGVQPVPSRMETRKETVARLRAMKLNGGF